MDDQQVSPCPRPVQIPNHRLHSAANERRIKQLAPLFGHSKVRLLLALAQPATTTELAALTHATPSAVSQLLHRLLAVGLLRQKRRGREVFYRLSPRGLALMSLFEDDDYDEACGSD
ncbi:MAG: helix-turn-helix domain-containing protein [Pseudomonadota bacterium]